MSRILRRNRKSAFVSVNGKVYRIPVGVLAALHEYQEKKDRSTLFDAARLIEEDSRKPAGKCRLVAELDMVLRY